MPRLDVLDEEFGEDAAAVLRARRRRTGARLFMLAIVALGLGAIGALAFAWSNADGQLRFALHLDRRARPLSRCASTRTVTCVCVLPVPLRTHRRSSS